MLLWLLEFASSYFRLRIFCGQSELRGAPTGIKVGSVMRIFVVRELVARSCSRVWLAVLILFAICLNLTSVELFFRSQMH